MADYSQSDLNTLSGFIINAETALNSGNTRDAINDVNLYYEDQIEERGYATDALEVVNDAGVFGLVANQELIDALGATQYAALLPSIVVDLAAADLNAITKNNDDIPTENAIANYHYDVYGKLGINLANWGGSAGSALGLDWA